MKAIKIILAVVVVAIMGFFVWRWLVSVEDVGTVSPPSNKFIERIEREIDSLKKVPANVFCQKFYEEIQYHIADAHKQGLLGKNESDNNQWKAILSKNLYSAYTPKFVEQAMYVFNRSEWKIADLNIIRNELEKLRSSAYLQKGSPISTKFTIIDSILRKYDQISGFISSCNNFSYSNYDIEYSFPDVNNHIQISRAYLSNNLDNEKVNNCIRLKDGLREVPEKLFDKHIRYLRTKIQKNSGRYIEYNYQVDYSSQIYTPLRNQIYALNNEIYGVNSGVFDSGYESLLNLLSADNSRAYEYFSKK